MFMLHWDFNSIASITVNVIIQIYIEVINRNVLIMPEGPSSHNTPLPTSD